MSAGLPYTLAPRIGSAGRMGLIVLRADETIEAEARSIWPAGDVALFTSRIPSGAEVSVHSLAQMEAEIPRAAGLLPQDMEFDVVSYACTSAASVIGPARVGQLVGSACRCARVSDPVSALVAACSALGVNRLALLSPYTESVSDALRSALADQGVETPVFGSFLEPVESRVARIEPASIREAAINLAADKAVDAVFMSCTNLRTLGILDAVENRAGKPALSSNQVLFWDMLRGVRNPPSGVSGALWDRDKPAH